MEQVFDAIADGLADKQYAIVDDFLKEEEVDAILKEDHFQHYQLHFKKAGIGKQANAQINEAIRGDLISWIDPLTALPSTHVYLSRLQDLIQFLNRALFLSLKDAEVHQTVYPVGSYYKRHLDQFKKDDARKLSVILYLNKNWKEENGGQLRIYTDDQSVDVLPMAGRLVCFRSDALEHEVLPATRERLSITGWILDRMKI
ncbi:MAG: 2OG-Fe(II) oxygenase [Cyclobacteriaceae bacterium]|jgi:SM-20-related protein|nr:2OG-Fe(II) oxygenase [Cyclobacteriaceae bacterium]